MDQPVQNPNHFLNELMTRLAAKTDAALAEKLVLRPPQISKLRHGKSRVTDRMLIKAHDATGLSINRLRELLYVAPEQAAQPSA